MGECCCQNRLLSLLITRGEFNPISFQYACGGSIFQSVIETNQVPALGVQQESVQEITQKLMETDINLEKRTDEMPGLEVSQKPVETCLDTAVETNISPEKEADLEARSVVNQNLAETCQDTVAEADVNPGKQADMEARSAVNQKPAETCQETVVEVDVNTGKQAVHPGTIYRCKRCRRMVATQESVITHKVGLCERRFLRRKSYHVDDKEPECTCIFVEPMRWMQAVEEGYVSNKLWCMSCKTRLGSFNWAGMQCSCGAWVVPAFQLLKSRIDESPM